MPQSNQHLPIPPDTFLRPLVRRYFLLKKWDHEICDLIKTHWTFDAAQWGLSKTSIKRARQRFGFHHARGQKNTLQSIAPYIQKLRKKYPTRGARKLTDSLFVIHGVRAPRELVELYLRLAEPEAVQSRRRHRLGRRICWSAGINDIWPQDQHDKWKRFGLFLHVSLEMHGGYINWLKIWWTNRNSRLITRFYLDRAREIGGIPLVTQSDPGTENNGVANAHTLLRRALDPSLEDAIQHRWMRILKNIKPEILWSMLRRDWAVGFETILQLGLDMGWYDPDPDFQWSSESTLILAFTLNAILNRLVFRWLSIPWLQQELDIWVEQQNMTSRRANKNKVLPHGPPALIHERPEKYGCLDFKVNVPKELFDQVEAEFCPPDHPVFKLVPPVFKPHIKYHYETLGRPAVNEDSFWEVYRNLLTRLRDALPQHVLNDDPALAAVLTQNNHQQDYDDVPEADRITPLPGRALRPGGLVVGSGSNPTYEYVGGLEDPEIPSVLLEPDDEEEERAVQDIVGGFEGEDADVGNDGDDRDWFAPAQYAVFLDTEDEEE
ncbi:hypothetical protein OF83DRAFT_1278963 [Amylostereum chailletii]|nr:hypothetical protein OF83DRAFT_1278963 [Amylostereum chailletii]